MHGIGCQIMEIVDTRVERQSNTIEQFQKIPINIIIDSNITTAAITHKYISKHSKSPYSFTITKINNNRLQY